MAKKRQNNVLFRLDDCELAHLKSKVGKSGMSQEAYLRTLLNGKIPQDRPPREYFDFLKEVRMIGRNINQIGMIANATGVIYGDRYKDDFDSLMDALLRIREAVELPRKIESQLI